MLRKSPPSLPDSLSNPPIAISTIHRDSGVAGKACILSGCRQSCGSRDITRTVLSLRPMATNLERCSPAGTVPSAMHCTSEDISFRSVYSLSWPDCEGMKMFVLPHALINQQRGIGKTRCHEQRSILSLGVCKVMVSGYPQQNSPSFWFNQCSVGTVALSPHKLLWL